MKKYLLLMLFIALCFISCNNSKDVNNINNSSDTVTIIDALGREVTLKKDITKIISIDRGFIPQTLKALGKDNLLVATGGVYPQSGPYNTERSDNFYIVTNILSIPNVGWAGYGSYNFEKILEVSPDAIIIVPYGSLSENSYHQELINRIENEFKIPVIILNDHTIATNLNSYYDNIRIISKVVNAEDKSEELIKKLQEYVDLAKSFKKDNDTDKMLFLGLTDSETGAGYVHGKDYGGAAYTTSILGISNAYEKSEMPILGAEDILEMNPDVIAMIDSPQYSKAIETYTKNPVFQNINAVKNKRVYSMGQVLWWSDPKLLLPIQLLLFSYVYYMPENVNIREIYDNYMSDIFGIKETDKLIVLHKLEPFFEQIKN
ncbi:ABC transporter substrate-binding protein [Brachyspira pilosicoli]|uniref:ABC transporter substrate-binding protein n=1 Tax=Brachyspira pilosicoli TaxID=52584 RepID=A0A5C8EJR5_BRAPL|nr:ABC transporter substrate-binding protein [Brachyspira pilosicoli]TXJ36360.1 ABC transporter substrate-binding protein [Brachyspira pilosicoli]